MNERAMVFICSTQIDLSEERGKVLEAVRRVQLQHQAMEYFGASPNQPLEVCLERVRQSDILIVIVGHLYGSLVPGTDKSFVETEYEEGYAIGKLALVYVIDDDVRILPKNFEQDINKAPLLKAFKENLFLRHTVARFRNSDDLAIRVAADLGREVQYEPVSQILY